MIIVRILIFIIGVIVIMLSVSIEGIASFLCLLFGFFLIIFALVLPSPRKYVTKYFVEWDSFLKKGANPIDPLRDTPEKYIKVVPDRRKNIAQVISVKLDPEGDGREEEIIDEIPLAKI